MVRPMKGIITKLICCIAVCFCFFTIIVTFDGEPAGVNVLAEDGKQNSDEIATREESPSEQNDTITISAYSFDEEGNKKSYVDSTAANFPEGITEDKFFAKPILTKESLAAAISGGGS